MSRKIDLTKQLTEDDLRYLVDRDRWEDIRANARNLGLPEPNLPSARGIRMQVPRKQLRNTDAFDKIADQLGVSVSDEDEDMEPAPPEPTPPAKPDDAESVDYAKMTVPQLKEELDDRRKAYEAAGDNEGVDLVSYKADAKKDDLIALLQLDDSEQEDDDN